MQQAEYIDLKNGQLNDNTVQWRTQEFFFGGGVQQIQLRTEDRDNGDLGTIAP